MYVCVCLAVTDQEVNDAIEGGAATRQEVTRACGAGGDCGACHDMIEDRLDARRAEADGVTLIPAAALVRERAA